MLWRVNMYCVVLSFFVLRGMFFVWALVHVAALAGIFLLPQFVSFFPFKPAFFFAVQ